MDWVHEYVPGQVRASCSICGCSRRFPDNLTYCIDKLFRCERCMETTAMELDMQIRSYRMQPDEVSQSVGLTPQGELPSTFLADAAERRALAIPGWTPTTQFYDDFTVVPGGVGSSWSVSLSAGSTITAPSVGVARFSGKASPHAIAWAPSISVPSPGVGRFYSSVSFTVVSGYVAAQSGLRVGAATISGGVPVGFQVVGGIAFAVPRFVPFGLGPTRRGGESTRQIDTEAHTAELWWSDGYFRYSLDGEIPVSVGAAANHIPTASPYMLVGNLAGAAFVVDITDYVCWS